MDQLKFDDLYVFLKQELVRKKTELTTEKSFYLNGLRVLDTLSRIERVRWERESRRYQIKLECTFNELLELFQMDIIKNLRAA